MKSTSTYIGVRRERNKWRADIYVDKKKKFLGYHNSELLAAEAYNTEVRKRGLIRQLNPTPSTPKLIKNRSAKSLTFQNMQVKTITLEVLGNRLLTLEDAVKEAVNHYLIFSKFSFNVSKVSYWIRESIKQGTFVLFDCSFTYDQGWTQQFDLSEVNTILEALYNNKSFVANTDSLGNYYI